MLEKRKLFDPSGTDNLENRKLLGGNPTGVSNLNSVKYSWVKPLQRTMLENFWIPHKVSMSEDKLTVKSLTDHENNAVKHTLSFLIFLDSIQVNNLPNIADYLTDCNISTTIYIQDFQEVIHTLSYQYILEGLYSNSEREEIYNLWRDNKHLLDRNSFIAEQYQQFIDKPDVNSFKRVLVANFLLEGIYFYNGFNLFEQLASRQKLNQTAQMIAYIKRDEATHLSTFTHLINELLDMEEDGDWVIEMVKTATEQEIAWGVDLYGDNILGISKKSTSDFIKHIANKRLRAIRLPEIYGDVKNPYSHLDLADTKRENFFETTVTQYSKSEAVDGWDDF